MIAPVPGTRSQCLRDDLARRLRHRLAVGVRLEQRAVGDGRAAHHSDDLPGNV